MRTNSHPDEPKHAQPTDVLIQPQMEGLQERRSTQSAPTVNQTEQEVESAEIRLEEARTVRYAIGKLNEFVQWFMVVLEVALAIRVFFKLIGADATNPFANFLYALTEIVIFPFRDIVHTPPRFAGETIIAMIIYWLIFWGIRWFLRILIAAPEEPIS